MYNNNVLETMKKIADPILKMTDKENDIFLSVLMLSFHPRAWASCIRLDSVDDSETGCRAAESCPRVRVDFRSAIRFPDTTRSVAFGVDAQPPISLVRTRGASRRSPHPNYGEAGGRSRAIMPVPKISKGNF